MGYDAGGNYTRQRNWSADASAGTKILASAMDQEFNDFASAMELALLHDGRKAATGNIPMGGNILTNVGSPTSATNYIRVKDVIENVPIYMIDAESSADRISVSAAYYTTASAATAPADSSRIIIKMGSDKSSAVAIRLNAGDGNPHSAAVVLANGSAIVSGMLYSGGIYEFLWNSSKTAWQLMNPSIIAATTASPGLIELATTAEAQAGTDATRAMTPQLVAQKFSASYATTASAGIVELATTAEGGSSDNVSAVITPAVLAAQNFATSANASAGGIGQIELATTAEVGSGTDTTRAVTPAALDFLTPYVMVLAINSVSAAPSIISNNVKASAWSFSSAGAGTYRIDHNIGLASVGGLAVSLQVVNTTAPRNRIAVLSSVDVSGFEFAVFNTSGSSEAGSATIHMIAHRMG